MAQGWHKGSASIVDVVNATVVNARIVIVKGLIARIASKAVVRHLRWSDI
jgi:adenine deaminase